MYFFLSKLLKPILLPFNILIISLVVFYYFKNLRRFLHIPIILLLLISIFPLGSFLEYHFLSKEYYGKNIKNYDSVLILGGDERRIIHGLSLWSLNKNSQIIFTGGLSYLFPDEDLKKQSEISQFNKLIKNLIKKDKIIILDNTRNTIENIHAYKKSKEVNNFNKTIVVSSVWHYKRVLKIAKIQNVDLIPYKWPSPIEKKLNILQIYQNMDFSVNISKFNNFVKEAIGLLAIYIFTV